MAPCQLSKGTIRFPLTEPVPLTLIEQITKFRAKEVAERAIAKSNLGRIAKPQTWSLLCAGFCLKNSPNLGPMVKMIAI